MARTGAQHRAILLWRLRFSLDLWPSGGRSHPFLNADNGLLILKYSSIYGIASIGAAIVIISGGIDLAPGAVIALAGSSLAGCSWRALAARSERRSGWRRGSRADC